MLSRFELYPCGGIHSCHLEQNTPSLLYAVWQRVSCLSLLFATFSPSFKPVLLCGTERRVSKNQLMGTGTPTVFTLDRLKDLS